MADVVTSKNVGDVGKPRPLFIHGKLGPATREWHKWAEKDDKGLKVEGTGGVVSYAEWTRLPKNRQGEKWFFEVDQRMFRPDFKDPTKRSAMVDFDDWRSVIQPGIMDTVGQGGDSFGIFADRAAEGTWFAEAELVYTGMYNGKPQNQMHFTRMTQDEAEIRAWKEERYPQEELVIPDESLERARTIYQVMTKGEDAERIAKFNAIVGGDQELSIYLPQFSEDNYAMIKG